MSPIKKRIEPILIKIDGLQDYAFQEDEYYMQPVCELKNQSSTRMLDHTLSQISSKEIPKRPIFLNSRRSIETSPAVTQNNSKSNLTPIRNSV